MWSANSILSSNKHDLNKHRSGIWKKYRSRYFFPPFKFCKAKDHCISYWSLLKIINPVSFVVDTMNLILLC